MSRSSDRLIKSVSQTCKLKQKRLYHTV